MDTEGETPHVLAKPLSCAVPEVEMVAQGMGVTCQRVFERAYVYVKHPPSFARAVFVRYINTEKEKRVLPNIVQAYCDNYRAKPKINGTARARKGFCAGCMLNADGRAAVAFAYPVIHPESEHTNMLFKPEEQPELPALEKLWMNLVNSGALSEPTEMPEDLMGEVDVL